MKIVNKFTLMMMTSVLLACGGKSEKKEVVNTKPSIHKNMKTLTSDRMTPETLLSFGRINGVTLSPNKKKVLYGVAYVSLKENKSNNELFLMDVDGKNKQQLTQTNAGEYQPSWINKGTEIAFMAIEEASKTMQLWKMNSDGTDRQCMTHVEGGISDYLFAPDGQSVVYVKNVKYAELATDKHPDLPKATGRLLNDLMFKHWDEWVDNVPHPFVAPVVAGQVGEGVDILNKTLFESPMKPFGGIEQLAWSVDSKFVAYTCKKKVGKAYATSTNSDIYLYDVKQHKTIKNISSGNMGYDQNPVFSPDGKWLAWESMEHDGWESDKVRILVYNFETKKRVDLSKSFDFNASSLSWSDDSQSIYFTGCKEAVTSIFNVTLEGDLTRITSEDCDYHLALPFGDKLIATRQSFSSPTEIYSVDIASGKSTNISQENTHLLQQLTMGKVEKRWIETVDHKKMLTWVVYPPHFDKTKKYPALLYCQGGPQSPVSQFWSYRWNIQTLVSDGYIMVMPNRRGVPGFGSEWIEEISGDYGGLCMQDYFSAIDAVKKESFVDENRLGCIGASFGGYSVYWMAGHHNKRFKAFVAHNGIFNFEQQYLETEEMFFANRDFGGPYWSKDLKVKENYKNSPHLAVDKWDTPILVFHSEKDYRILVSQGLAAFTAAQLRGIPSQMLYFPDECHWVLKPQNSIQWHRTFIDWLNKWLKKN